MTSSTKAFLKYGPLAAAMLVCAGLAALGSSKGFPVLAGPVKRVCLVGVAVAMGIQGAAMCPRKWESRLIVKPHVLAAGSLMLIAGAALILVLLVAGCRPARTNVRLAHGMNFTTAKRQDLGPCSALDGPKIHCSAIAIGRTHRIKTDRLPAVAICGLAVLDRSLCALKTAPARVRRAELTVALSRRQ